MNRVINAARRNIVAPGFSLVLPWAIKASSLVINILIWAVTDVSEVPGAATGGLASLYIALMFVYIQAVASLLPFAMGLSLTRRTFSAPPSLPRFKHWSTGSGSARYS